MLKITEPNFQTTTTTLQTKENDRFVSSLLFNQLQEKEQLEETTKNYPSSGAAAIPCPLYDGGVSVAVPFVWESKPGTPKHPSSLGQSPGLPPLTPPPSYSYHHNRQQPKKQPAVKLRRRLKFLVPEFWKALPPKIVFCIGMSRKAISSRGSSTAGTPTAGKKDRPTLSPRGRTNRQSSPVKIKRPFRISSIRSSSGRSKSTRKTRPLAGYLASKEDDEDEDNVAVMKSRRRRSPNCILCFSLW